MSNLKKALYVLLYDQFDSCDLEVDNSDETYIDYIVNALIEKNKVICPFKNYDCTQNCGLCTEKCSGDELSIDCGKEPDKTWRDFIGIESEDMQINGESIVKQFVSYAQSEGVINTDTADKLIKFAKHYVNSIDS